MPLRKLLFLAVLVALLALAVACGGDSEGEGGGDDASAIRSTLDRMFEAAGDGDWQAMYDLMSSRYRARCPFARFTRLARQSEESIAKRALIDVQDILVSGDQAEATVVVEISGSRISGAFGFVREDGAWRHDPAGGPSSLCEGVF